MEASWEVSSLALLVNAPGQQRIQGGDEAKWSPTTSRHAEISVGPGITSDSEPQQERLKESSELSPPVCRRGH